jgi:hypothetical protein
VCADCAMIMFRSPSAHVSYWRKSANSCLKRASIAAVHESAFGTKRTSHALKLMSAFDPTFSSRVRRSSCSCRSAALELRGRTAFGALRRSGAAVLRPPRFNWFAACSGAPSHCLPRGSGQGIVPVQTSTLEAAGAVLCVTARSGARLPCR